MPLAGALGGGVSSWHGAEVAKCVQLCRESEVQRTSCDTARRRALDPEPRYPRVRLLRMIYRLMIHRRLRVSEAVGMRRDQLDLKRSRLWVERVKDLSSRQLERVRRVAREVARARHAPFHTRY